MSICKQDVKQAILDKVLTELNSRYTYSRISQDTIRINSIGDNINSKVNSKANPRQQAKQIANSVLKSIYNSYNGYVTGYVNDRSHFDPITVTFTVKDEYINHLYNTLPEQQTQLNLSPISEEESDRDFVNTNSDWNSFDNLNLDPTDGGQEEPKGVYLKFIEHKQRQLNTLRTRLNRVENAKKEKNVTVQRLNELSKEQRELNLAIDGNFELGRKGLVQEIQDFKSGATRSAIGYYAEKELQGLDKLTNSNNIDNIREAKSIINFYTAAGTFERGVENPFFMPEEIFLKDDEGKETTEYRISEETRKQYEDWARKAIGYNNIVSKREEEIVEDAVNNDSSVINTYGADNKFGYNSIVNKREGLKDTHWVDMWTMDITSGIFSHNGILPQVIFSKIANSTESKRAWSRDIAERVDNILHDLTKELSKPKFKSKLEDLGINGIDGVSYKMFQEKTKEGLDTHTLIGRYEKQFNDDWSLKLSEFYNDFNKAISEENDMVKARKINEAFNRLKGWKLNNTIIMDISKIPEIANDSEYSDFGAVADDNYKKYLVDILGNKGYQDEVNKQKDLLNKYKSKKQSFIEELLIHEDKTDPNELSGESKSKIEYWDTNHSPLKGVEDYSSVSGISFGTHRANSFMDFNNLIPRKYKVNIKSNIATNKYEFTDTNELTGNYSKVFQLVENNPVLNEFYEITKEVCETIRKNLPSELQDKVPANTLPGLRKASSEILADKNIGILKSIIPAFKNLIEKLKLGFGVVKQGELSYAKLEVNKDGTKSNYSVNSSFLENNSRSISERRFLETTKFLQAYNSNGTKQDIITKNTTLPLSSFNTSSLISLASYINVDISLNDIKNGNIKAIRDKIGDKVEIGRIIKDFSVHSVVQSQSFDLPKLLKYFSDMTMVYSAKQEALPLLEILKNHYEAIKKPDTTNVDNPILNVPNDIYHKAGLRTSGIKQFENWFDRVVLGNYGMKHAGASKTNNIFSREEKAKIKEIEELLKEEKDEDKIKELNRIKAGLGRVFTATAAIDNMLNFVRFQRLGFNLSSATTNLVEGVTSNMILAADDKNFDPKELFYGYSLIKHSFVKNATFGLWEPGESTKLRKLMDKFNVLMDSKNELQKSSRKTRSSKLSWLGSFELNNRVEYINQSPLMVAMLRTLKLKDKEGNEGKLWDAFNDEGKLKDNFKTEENVENWEQLSGTDYLNFKQKLHSLIVLGHGNYDELRGMMIKSSGAGKTLAMFKTWLPQAIYWRFAKEQDNIQAGEQGFKGRYLSYGKGSAAVHGAVVGLATFGPIGAAIGAAAGIGLGYWKGVDTGMGLIKETILTTKQLFLTSLGMPVNLFAGKYVTLKNGKAFDKWVGKGNFTERDARNLKSNMADLVMQLAWVGLILLAKSLFWDDDDKPDDAERIAHNILVNKLMQMSSQAAMYTNPVEIHKSTIGSIGVLSFLTDAGKLIQKSQRALEGRDITASGSNRGQSGFGVQITKMLLPGIFKDEFLGFGSQAQRQFQPSPFDQMFKSPAKIDAEQNKAMRAARKQQLLNSPEVKAIEDDKEKAKYIRDILDDELPTPTRLKNLDETREEYNKSNQ